MMFALLLTLAFAATAGATVTDLNEAGRAAYARGDGDNAMGHRFEDVQRRLHGFAVRRLTGFDIELVRDPPSH